MLCIKLRKIYLTVTFLCINMIYCSSIFAEEVSTQNGIVDSNTPQDKIITTFELVNEWKATLFSRPFKYADSDREHTLYYVGVKKADSDIIHTVWECIFPDIYGLGKFTPQQFVFGPAEGNELCLSFLLYQSINSLYYFILDPNNVNDIEDKNSTFMRLFNRDPNVTIPLSKIFGPYRNTDILVNIEKMNSVSVYNNTATFNFSSLKNNYIFRYSIAGDKPVYSAYILNKIEEPKGK